MKRKIIIILALILMSPILIEISTYAFYAFLCQQVAETNKVNSKYYPIFEEEFGVKIPEEAIINNFVLINFKDVYININLSINKNTLNEFVKSIKFEYLEEDDEISDDSIDKEINSNDDSTRVIIYKSDNDLISIDISKYNPRNSKIYGLAKRAGFISYEKYENKKRNEK